MPVSQTEDTLKSFKTALREHLRVPDAIDAQKCVACTRANTWSVAGEQEYRKTGLCEDCWIVLGAPASSERDRRAVSRCDRLKDTAGCEFMAKWLIVTKCLKVDQVSMYAKFDADYLQSVVSGKVALPDVWQPGLRLDSLEETAARTVGAHK